MKTLSFLAPVLLIAAILGVWQAACVALYVPEYLLPAPTAIGVALLRNAGVLAVSAWRTLAS